MFGFFGSDDVSFLIGGLKKRRLKQLVWRHFPHLSADSKQKPVNLLGTLRQLGRHGAFVMYFVFFPDAKKHPPMALPLRFSFSLLSLGWKRDLAAASLRYPVLKKTENPGLQIPKLRS